MHSISYVPVYNFKLVELIVGDIACRVAAVFLLVPDHAGHPCVGFY